MQNFIKAALLALVLALAAPVAAQDFAAGWAAYKRGDYAAALREFRPLADQGNAKALFNLGVMYDKGQGVPQDYAEAERWYRQAADQGVASAQYYLGFMYANGQGVPQDHAEAARWYRKAADQGVASATYHLGGMYANGRGVPQDYVQAHMWWNVAASQGDERAILARYMVARMMTPAQIAEAQELAREWRPK